MIRGHWWIVPKRREVICSRFVLRNKLNQDGTVEQRKARLVARGFSQLPGVDFDETFAPVVRLNSIRIVLSLAAQCNMKIHQLDVMTVYLNGELEEQIFMEIPKFLEQILEEIINSEKKGKMSTRLRVCSGR